MKLETFSISITKHVVTTKMETFHVESVVRGYHPYKDIWMPNRGDTFDVKSKEQKS